MIADPNLEVTSILGWLREMTIITTVILFGWKARGVYQVLDDFIKDIKTFMSDMRLFAHRVETNHLTHMEASLRKIAGESVLVEDPTDADSKV